MSYFTEKRNFNFVARHSILLKLEGDYSDFVFSCRHRDILRCSVTRHFRSCYSPDGMYKNVPKEACTQPNVALLFKRDGSGQFLWRAFVKLVRIGSPFRNNVEDYLKVGKFYGNQNLEYSVKDSILKKLKPLRVDFLYEDLTAL